MIKSASLKCRKVFFEGYLTPVRLGSCCTQQQLSYQWLNALHYWNCIHIHHNSNLHWMNTLICSLIDLNKNHRNITSCYSPHTHKSYILLSAFSLFFFVWKHGKYMVSHFLSNTYYISYNKGFSYLLTYSYFFIVFMAYTMGLNLDWYSLPLNIPYNCMSDIQYHPGQLYVDS